MPRGGRRQGAGRKKGAAVKKTREAANLILASGTTPLGYFQGLLEGTMIFDEVKFEAAKAAAPYVHARLAAIEHSGEITKVYVARLPQPIADIDEWKRQTTTSLQ